MWYASVSTVQWWCLCVCLGTVPSCAGTLVTAICTVTGASAGPVMSSAVLPTPASSSVVGPLVSSSASSTVGGAHSAFVGCTSAGIHLTVDGPPPSKIPRTTVCQPVPVSKVSGATLLDPVDQASLSSGVSHLEVLDTPCLTEMSALAPLGMTYFTPITTEGTGLSFLQSCYSPSAASEAAADESHEV